MAKRKDKAIPVPQDEPKLVKELRKFVADGIPFIMLDSAEVKQLLAIIDGGKQ